MYSYLSAVSVFTGVTPSNMIRQKLLPKVFGEQYRSQLDALRGLCTGYASTLGTGDVVDEIQALAQDEFVTFWNVT